MTPLPDPSNVDPKANSNIDQTTFDVDLHIHGLNKSFLDHIEKLFKIDPTKDLSGHFDTYKNHLQKIRSRSRDENTSLDLVVPKKLEGNEEGGINMATTQEIPTIKTDGYKPLFPRNTSSDKCTEQSSFLSAPSSTPTPPGAFNSESKQFSFATATTKPLDLPQQPFSFMKPSLDTKNLFSFSSSTLSATPTSTSSSVFSFLNANKPAVANPQESEKGSDLQKDDAEDGEQDELIVVEEVDPYAKGPGEESDTVLFALKCKIYIMALSQSDKTWQDLGVASIRINETSSPDSPQKHRVIARAQGSTSKLLLNSYASGVSLMPLKPSDKSVSFISLSPDEKLTCYLVRVKTEALSQTLYSHLEKYSRKDAT